MLRAIAARTLQASGRTLGTALTEASSAQQAGTHLPWQALCVLPQWVRPFSGSQCVGQEAPGGRATAPEGGASSSASAGDASQQQQQQQREGQQSAATDAEGAEDFDADVAELQQLLSKAQEEAASFRDRWQRSHAEMQNLIARQAREKEALQTYAVQKFAESLLEVADNLESAAKAVPSGVLQEGAEVPAEVSLKYLRALLAGVLATERVLLKTMGSKGVQRIETAEGDAFDPNTHEAMSTMPSPGPDKKPGTIANVWQSGYKIHDRVLRAGKVIVYQE